MFNYLLNLIYPNVCGICSEINADSLCKKCKIKIKKMEITKIDKYTNKNFREHIYIFKYEKLIRDLLIDYKFNDKVYLYKTFSRIIMGNKKILDFIGEYDIIIPVPLYKKRFNIRGYNQSYLILEEICNKIKTVNINDNILKKIKNNLPQSTLNKKERRENIKNVYIINDIERIKNKRILLFDDIYTTGNTVNECARILKENGSGEIGVFTIAKD